MHGGNDCATLSCGRSITRKKIFRGVSSLCAPSCLNPGSTLIQKWNHQATKSCPRHNIVLSSDLGKSFHPFLCLDFPCLVTHSAYFLSKKRFFLCVHPAWEMVLIMTKVSQCHSNTVTCTSIWQEL